MALNRRQQIALDHPCARAPELLDARFWMVEKSPVRGLLVRSGLTVNK